MNNRIKISASLMCCNQLELGKEVLSLIKAGCDSFHIDIMDGTFVQNFAMNISNISQIRKITDLFIDVHLMINNPGRYLRSIKEAGASSVHIHVESCKNLISTVNEIKKLNLKVGIAIGPKTPIKALSNNLLENIDYILVMAVNPGFSGQEFIPETVKRVAKLQQLLKKSGKENIEIHVDGAVNKHTIKDLYHAGAVGFVAGTAGLFNKGVKYETCILRLKEAV